MIVIGAILNAMAALIAIVCLVALRRHRASARRERTELLSILKQQREETARQILEIRQMVEVLNDSRPNREPAYDDAFPLSRRRDAIRLLRSGVSPENAAASLGIAAREMRLIARISQILTVE